MDERYPSLDRYLRTRGSHLLGHSLVGAGLVVQTWLGAAFLAGGVAMAVCTQLGGVPDLLPASVSLILPGAINLAVATGVRRRLGPQGAVDVQMSPDARTLLLAVYRQFVGWPSTLSLLSPFRAGGRLRHRRLQRRLARRGFNQPLPEISEEVLERLNSAATQHNRIAAALSSARGDSPVVKMVPRVLAAADEAMATIFDRAATLCRYPEGADAGRAEIGAQIAALEETATRLEALAATQRNATDPVGTGRLGGLIEDLRLEQLARSELRQGGSEGGSVSDRR